MAARLDIGEVLLNASIVEVVPQVVCSVVARNLAVAYQIGQGVSRDAREVGRLAEGQNALGVERNRELSAQVQLNLRYWQPDAIGNRIGDIEMKRHVHPALSSYSS